MKCPKRKSSGKVDCLFTASFPVRTTAFIKPETIQFILRFLFLTNNSIGDDLYDWLGQSNEVIYYTEKISPDDISKILPDYVISYSYRHIIRKEILDILPGRFLNLHVFLLPFNRGADPNAWSFLEGTPKGVTIHLIDPGVDTGPIIAQKEISFDDEQTLAQTYILLHKEIQNLFKENWEKFCNSQINPKPQVGEGSFHFSKEFAAIREKLFLNDGWNVTIAKLQARHQALKIES